MSRPVFDLDSVHGLQLISEMNRGMEHEINAAEDPAVSNQIFCRCGRNPFKQQEAELMGQYYKLRKKIAAGANFAITQIGYDVRKWHELLMCLRSMIIIFRC